MMTKHQTRKKLYVGGDIQRKEGKRKPMETGIQGNTEGTKKTKNPALPMQKAGFLMVYLQVFCTWRFVFVVWHLAFCA